MSEIASASLRSHGFMVGQKVRLIGDPTRPGYGISRPNRGYRGQIGRVTMIGPVDDDGLPVWVEVEMQDGVRIGFGPHVLELEPVEGREGVERRG